MFTEKMKTFLTNVLIFWLTRKTLCLPKDHRQSIEKKVKIYNPSELSSKLLYL